MISKEEDAGARLLFQSNEGESTGAVYEARTYGSVRGIR